MSITRRIFVSMPADEWLTPAQNDLKWRLVERVENLGYTPEIFLDPTGRQSLAASHAWSAERVDEVVRHCHGAVVIGLPRWSFEAEGRAVLLPTEFSQYEGALARTLALPLLIVVQANLRRRVVFDFAFGPYVGTFPPGADSGWLESPQFEVTFKYWREALERRRDVFLGYSGGSTATAELLRDFLEKDIGVTVLDWQRDFRPGRTILDEIEEARVRCTTGVFLFTKDDLLAGRGSTKKAAPRDNVVFEAGYFISAKGKDRVLVVREVDAKMPADLGGDIYASLEERTSLASIEATVRKFFAAL
jgi:hypothetical protein